MKLRSFNRIAALTIGFFAASAASAATVNLNQSFDLTSAFVTSTSLVPNGINGFAPRLSTTSPLTLNNGDTLDYKLTFLPGQSLQLSSFLGGLQLDIATGGTGTFGQDLGTLNLFDTSGNLITSFDTSAGIFFFEVNGGVGQDFLNVNVPLTASIGSVELINTNISGLANGGTNFIASVFTVNATSGTLQVSSALPEPSTWAMLLIGFLGIGMVLRSRRSPMLSQLA